MPRTTPERSSQFRKGALELAILALLGERPRYGGELVEELSARPGLETTAGTVYPLLSRLAKAGAVRTTWQESSAGPPRKYYDLSASGRRDLAALTLEWTRLARGLDTLLKEVTP